MLHKVGPVAYKLKLPAYSQIHPTFHVSLLKKTISPRAVISPELPMLDMEGRPKIVPLAVLDRRMIKRDNKVHVQFLIHWANSHIEDATWEDG